MDVSHSTNHRRLTDQEFSSLFLDYKKEAFRVETLPSYDAKGDDARFAAFRRDRNEIVPPAPEFLEKLKRCREEGRQRICVRVIPDSPKLDLYIQYEVEWCFPYNISAGMEGRFILPENFSPTIRAGMGKDFWLFDNQRGVEMLYDPSGKYEGANLAIHPRAVAEMCSRKEEYLAASIDAETFMAMYRGGRFKFQS